MRPIRLITHHAIAGIKYALPDATKMCGDGRIEQLADAPASPALRSAYVKFTDGAYTKWHSHTGEQLLIATSGKGFVQLRGQPIQELHEGDRVFIPADVWHRHGAIEGGTFIHLAVTTGETQWDDGDPCRRDSTQ